jgi:signal peptidase II
MTLRKWAPLAIIAPLMVLLDQITKTWVLENLTLRESIYPINALSEFFALTRSYNTGAAFGVLPSAGPFFMVTAMVITAIIVFFYVRSERDALAAHIGMSLVIGGALGNVIDRIIHGKVIDFIHYRVPDLFSNVSNLADHAIVIGVFILIVDSFARDWRHKQRGKAQAALPSSDTDAD